MFLWRCHGRKSFESTENLLSASVKFFSDRGEEWVELGVGVADEWRLRKTEIGTERL